jgi:hypothetical protein
MRFNVQIKEDTMWVRYSDLRVGDVVRVTGFTCIPDDAEVVVEDDGDGELCIPCDKGRHHLLGQKLGSYPSVRDADPRDLNAVGNLTWLPKPDELVGVKDKLT